METQSTSPNTELTLTSEVAGASEALIGKVVLALRASPRMTSSRPMGTLASVVYGRLWTA